MADYGANLSGLLTGSAVEDAYAICKAADDEIGKLLDAVRNNTSYTSPDGSITLTQADFQSGAGTLLVDRLMSELSNLESLSANALATLQRIAKEINSKLT